MDSYRTGLTELDGKIHHVAAPYVYVVAGRGDDGAQPLIESLCRLGMKHGAAPVIAGRVTVEDLRLRVSGARRVDGAMIVVLVECFSELLLECPGSSASDDVQRKAVALHSLGKEFGCAVLVGVEPEFDVFASERNPLLSLPDPGALEEVAAVVMFTRVSPRNPEVVDVLIAKNRHGERGAFQLAWNGPLMRVSNLEVRHD